MGLDIVNYEELWKQLYEFYGERLAHPEVEPRRFAWQLKIFKHVIDINKHGQNPTQ